MRTTKKIALIGVKDAGVPGKERIVLRAKAPITLSDFAVIPTGYSPDADAVVDLNYYVFWFPSVDVAPGDTILIYTGEGENTSFRNGSGHQSYVFHWGFQKPILDDEAIGGLAVLEIAAWLFKPLAVAKSNDKAG